jgi:hypothetical protein
MSTDRSALFEPMSCETHVRKAVPSLQPVMCRRRYRRSPLTDLWWYELLCRKVGVDVRHGEADAQACKNEPASRRDHQYADDADQTAHTFGFHGCKGDALDRLFNAISLVHIWIHPLITAGSTLCESTT